MYNSVTIDKPLNKHIEWQKFGKEVKKYFHTHIPIDTGAPTVRQSYLKKSYNMIGGMSIVKWTMNGPLENRGDKKYVCSYIVSNKRMDVVPNWC